MWVQVEGWGWTDEGSILSPTWSHCIQVKTLTTLAVTWTQVEALPCLAQWPWQWLPGHLKTFPVEFKPCYSNCRIFSYVRLWKWFEILTTVNCERDSLCNCERDSLCHQPHWQTTYRQHAFCFPCFDSSHGPSKGDCCVKLSEVSDRSHQDLKPKEPKNGGIAEKANWNFWYLRGAIAAQA